jgi:hypothetical protein
MEANFKENYKKNTLEDFAISIFEKKELKALKIENPKEFVEKVSLEIELFTENNFEKIKIVHDLVVLLISPNFHSEEYAILFKSFCDKLDINCKIINGYAKKNNNNFLTVGSGVDFQHFWNLIEIYNTKYLVDCSWDSCYFDGSELKKYYNTDWFLVEENNFKNSHVPFENLIQKTDDSVKNPILKQGSPYPYFGNISQTLIILPGFLSSPYFKIIYEDNLILTLNLYKASLFVKF